jgi:hypothetical protein
MSPRRKVVEVLESAKGWNQYWIVLLSCGHQVVAHGRNGKRPLTSSCWICRNKQEGNAQ